MLAQIQAELRAITDRQNAALNILSGTYYSYNGNRLMGHGDGMPKHDGTGVPVDDPRQQTPIVLPPVEAPSNAGPLPNASGYPVPGATPAAIDLGLLGQTKFAELFNRLTTYQVDEAPLEAQAAQVRKLIGKVPVFGI